MGQQWLRYGGGSPYELSMGRVCSPGTTDLVTSSYFIIFKQTRGVKLTKSRVWPASYNLCDKIGGKIQQKTTRLDMGAL